MPRRSLRLSEQSSAFGYRSEEPTTSCLPSEPSSAARCAHETLTAGLESLACASHGRNRRYVGRLFEVLLRMRGIRVTSTPLGMTRRRRPFCSVRRNWRKTGPAMTITRVPESTVWLSCSRLSRTRRRYLPPFETPALFSPTCSRPQGAKSLHPGRAGGRSLPTRSFELHTPLD